MIDRSPSLSRRPVLALASALGLACLPAAAATLHPPAAFSIRGFAIHGDNPLSSGDTSAVLAPFLRPDATLELLQRAAAALEAELHRRGHGLYRVVLPQQTLEGTVSLDIERARVERLDVVSAAGPTDSPAIAAALAAVPELTQGGSPNLHRLARQVALANQNPARRVGVDLSPGRSPDAVSAVLRIDERDPLSFAAAWHNSGTGGDGSGRFTLDARHARAFGTHDHVLAATYTTPSGDPFASHQGGLSYRAPLPRWGTTLFAAHVRSDTPRHFGLAPDGRVLGGMAQAAGQTTRIGAAWTLAPSSSSAGTHAGQWVLALDDRQHDAASSAALAVEPRSRPLMLAFIGRLEATRSLLDYHLEFSANGLGGSGNSLATYQAEDPAVGSTQWSMLRGGAQHVVDSRSGWQWASRLQGQWASTLLLPAEAFGLGGAGSVRGAADRALVGDSGLALSFEATTPAWATGLRACAFVDAGAVRSHGAGSIAGARLRSDRLASLGVGLRYAHASGLSLRADYAQIVMGSRLSRAENPGSPENGDDKLHVSLTYTF